MSRTKAPENFRGHSNLLGSQIEYKPVTLHLPAAHPKQYEMITSIDQPGVRFSVGSCGTKFGA